MMTRQRFALSGSSSPFSDTGPPFTGYIMQLAWYPSVVDTGGDLAIDLMPNIADTGEAITIYNDNDCLGTRFLRAPTQPQHHPDGFDTGASSDVPVVGAGDRLRIRVTPAASSIAGTLYVWIAEY